MSGTEHDSPVYRRMVSREDPGHQVGLAYRVEIAEESASDVFGHDAMMTLSMYDNAPGVIKSNRFKNKSREDVRAEAFAKVRAGLRTLWSKDAANKQVVKTFFAENNVVFREVGLEAGPINFDESIVSDEVLERMLTVHSELFYKRESEFRKRFPGMVQDFYNLLKSRVEEGKPEDKVFRTVLENYPIRTRKYHILTVDAMAASLDELWGQYSADYNTIEIAEQIPEAQVYKTFVHEFFHLLSGKAIFEESDTPYDNKDPESRLNIIRADALLFFEYPRVGLRMRSEHSRKYRWLNEALTENLTAKLLRRPAISYIDEREVLDIIIKSALKRSKGKKFTQEIENLFYDAYFEDYNPNASAKKRIPKWRKLKKSLDKLFWNGFLNEVDRAVAKRGVKKTIPYLTVLITFG